MAGHMYRMAMMTFLFSGRSGDANSAITAESVTEMANQEGARCKVDRERLISMGHLPTKGLGEGEQEGKGIEGANNRGGWE